MAPVLVRPSTQAATGATAEAVLMRWGMSTPGPQSRALINARRETLLQLPTFRRVLLHAHGSRRCAVPATGFYEWYKSAGGSRSTAEPFLIRRNLSGAEDVPRGMFMAGLYDVRKGSEGEQISFVIITTSACSEFSWLHNRQPCFLDTHQEVDDWLDAARVPADKAVLRLLETRSGIAWRRMMPGLEKEAENQSKPKAQSSIKSFFALKGQAGPKQVKRKNSSKYLDSTLGVNTSQAIQKERGPSSTTASKNKSGAAKIASSFVGSASKQLQ